jgi:hypothetical protein
MGTPIRCSQLCISAFSERLSRLPTGAG